MDRPKKLIRLGPGDGHQHTASVLLLHGFGDNAAGWFEPAMWWAERLPHVRFILPTAPVSATMGTTSWFDFGGSEMEASFVESVNNLTTMLSEEEATVGSSRIVVAGFSQGGALAYHLGLTRTSAPLGGVVAMSTFLRGEASANVADSALSTPVLICHGTDDDRIPGGAAGAQLARDELSGLGMKHLELIIYDGMGHSACDKELHDVLRWLQRTLPEETSRL